VRHQSVMIRVSVIIPCKDRSDLLGRALRSVRRQVEAGCDFELEVIVVDDGSEPALDPADGQVDRLVRHETNLGASAARNSGVEAASGDVIAFLDSDDLWHSDKVARQIAFLQQAPSERLEVYGAGYLTKRRSQAHYSCIVPSEVSDVVGFASGCRFCPGSTALMRREVFEAVGPFDTSLARLEDVDWYLRFGLLGGLLKVVPAPLCFIRPNPRVDPGAVASASDQLEAKYEGLLDREAARGFLAYLALTRAEAAFVNGRPLSCLMELTRSFLRAPRGSLQMTRVRAEPLADDELDRMFPIEIREQ